MNRSGITKNLSFTSQNVRGESGNLSGVMKTMSSLGNWFKDSKATGKKSRSISLTRRCRILSQDEGLGWIQIQKKQNGQRRKII